MGDGSQLNAFLREIEVENISFDSAMTSTLFAAYMRCQLQKGALSLWATQRAPRTIQLYTSLIAACNNFGHWTVVYCCIFCSLSFYRFLHNEIIKGLKQDIRQ